jgi:hypothetical protein
MRAFTAIADVIWYGHRRIRCHRHGHIWSPMTDPILCLWCGTRGWEKSGRDG